MPRTIPSFSQYLTSLLMLLLRDSLLRRGRDRKGVLHPNSMSSELKSPEGAELSSPGLTVFPLLEEEL